MIGFLRRLRRKNNIINKKREENYLKRKYVTIITDDNDITESEKLKTSSQIAIQIHCYFVELLDEILENVNNIPYVFDCYISTDTQEKAEIIEREFLKRCRAKKVIVEVFENRGRDVAPFLIQMQPVINQYKYIGHIHTKRSLHTDFGEDWRKYLFRHLLGSEKYVTKIFDLFEKDESLGFIFPDVYPILKEYLKWDGARENVDEMLKKSGLSLELPNEPVFPTGNMFWARSEAVRVLFELGYSMKDFPNEEGQLNLTLAHAIERVWIYLMEAQGYSYKMCMNAMCSGDKSKKNRLFIYGGQSMRDALEKYGDIYGEDWTKVTVDILKKYEQVIFVEDSCVGPFVSLEDILEKMNDEKIEMWSIVDNPLFFFCLNNSVIELEKFREIWETLIKTNVEVSIKSLCQKLLDEKILLHVYLPESKYIGKWVHSDFPQTELPYEFVLLGSPFVRKDAMKAIDLAEKNRLFACLEQLPGKERVAELYEENC